MDITSITSCFFYQIMDLNKAMVGLYKQKQDSSQKRNPGKSRKPQETNNVPHIDTSQADETIPKKRSKVDDILSSLVCEPKTTFDKLYGCTEAISRLHNIIHRFQRYLNNESTKSGWPVLICGSRGLGKTSLVEAAANHAKLKLFVISFKTLIEQTRNELKLTLSFMTRHCQANQPAMVLLDNIDLVNDKEELRNIVNGTILRLMDEENKLLVFCTASSTLDVDSSVEFLQTIQLKRPDTESRWQILKLFREQNKNLCDLTDETLRTLAINTPSFSALHLKKMFDIAETDSYGKPSKVHCDLAINSVKNMFKRGTHLIGERPTVTWDDIGGLPEVRFAFSQILRMIKTGNINCKFAGIALYGPPGCGKTMVAQAMANEAGLNFISIKPAELVDKYLGETEKNIRRVFSEAQEHEPCMIYFDEFDGLCGTRGNRDTVTGAIQTLLSEMDGFVNRGRSIILASTNRLEDIDPAMKRPGRLSKHIEVGPPNTAARLEILRKLTKNFRLSPDVNLQQWAEYTENFTGADLSYWIAEAEMRASQNIPMVDIHENSDIVHLTEADLKDAVGVIFKTNVELAKKKLTTNKINKI